MGDIKTVPCVTLNCEAEFLNIAEALAFFKATKHLAADTLDRKVTFHKFCFAAADTANTFFGESENMMRRTTLSVHKTSQS